MVLGNSGRSLLFITTNYVDEDHDYVVEELRKEMTIDTVQLHFFISYIS